MAKSRPKARTKEERAAFAEKRRQQVAALRERLAKWQEDTDPAVIAAVCAQLDGYSERNAMLIAMQYPEATDVEGYNAWRARGRQVKARPPDVEPGEWGIKIIAYAGGDGDGDGEVQVADTEVREVVEPGEADGRMSRRFRLAYVYDITQTDLIHKCRYCAEPVEQDDGTGLWETSAWRKRRAASESADARRYCTASPDRQHAPAEDREPAGAVQ